MDQYVRETRITMHEIEVARRWWGLDAGTRLPLNAGGTYRLLFPGRPGGAAGPDVRDAILQEEFVAPEREALHVGDVEFHVRASDWFGHRHHLDARYNAVILHVVLICDAPVTIRQDGTCVPLCSLNDLPPSPVWPGTEQVQWPCHPVIRRLDVAARARLLTLAGLLRFEQKAQLFVEQVRRAHAHRPFSAPDTCLIPALAESCGYGRDRVFFRTVGLALLGLPHPPFVEQQEAGTELRPLDVWRLRALHELVATWLTMGAWLSLRAALESASTPPEAIEALRARLKSLGRARADIAICNVVLPFASAMALIEADDLLVALTRQVYLSYPRLTSNQVTRAMRKQLLLDYEPPGACQQQGLHYIYRETCREKLCAVCMAGKKAI